MKENLNYTAGKYLCIIFIVYVFVYFTNTRLLLAKIDKLYIKVVVYKTKFHERLYFWSGADPD
jgi:hypothetical protein